MMYKGYYGTDIRKNIDNPDKIKFYYQEIIVDIRDKEI